MSSSFILIYCSENQATVQKFSSDLSSTGAQFTLVAADKNANIGEVLNTSSPVILFITDNFLKNRNCMFQAYANYGHLIKNGQILAIIAEGYVRKTDGTTIPVTTRIERVANVIQYMNYWQDKYLSIRKEYNLGEISEDEVNVIKVISTEVGDFARLLKDSNFQYFENITARNYQLFCQIAGLPMPTHTALASEPAIEIVQPQLENEIVEDKVVEEKVAQEKEFENTDKEEIPQNQSIVIDTVATFEKEEAAIEEIISDIPGIGLLNNPIPNVQTTDSKFIKEIDEDDFFNTDKEKPSGSNVNEIMDEVIFEEENEANQLIETSHEVIEIQDIFEDEEPELTPTIKKVTEEDNDEVNSIFKNIIEKREDEVVTTENPVETEHSLNPTPENIEDTYSIMDIFKDTENESFELITLSSRGNEEDVEEKIKEEEDINQKLITALKLAKINDFKKATNILDDILEKNPHNADAYFILAEIAELNKDFIMAKAYYEKTVFIAPFYPLVYEKLAKLSAAHFTNEPKQTKKYFKQALKLDENNAALLYAYAEFLNDQMNNPEKAIKYFEKVLEVEANHPFANYDLAVIYYKLGNKAIAAEYYRNACENNEEISTEENDGVFLSYSILDIERADEAINLHTEEQEEVMIPLKTLIEEQEEVERNNEVEEVESIKEDGSVENVEVIEEISTSSEIQSVDTENTIEASVEEVEIPISKLLPKEGAKIILITGATAGIGKATAEIFAKNGYNVILTGRRQERLLELQNEFHEKYENGCVAIDFDVQNFQSIQDGIESLDDAWKNIDILVNNAGLALGLEPIQEGTLSHWDTMIDTNIKGLLYMTRLIAPQMVERRSGHIINLCSTAGKEAYANGNVYCATKFAVEALTRSMRIDLHKFGIRVGQVSPGAVETEFSNVRFEGDTERAAKVYDGFTPLIAEDVADIIYYMASAPAHVNIQDVLVMATQQASATIIDRSGKI